MDRTTSENWTPFLLVVLACFLVLGLVLGASEALNPSRAAAVAREQDAKAAAILAENQYQQQQRAIELETLRAKKAQEVIQMQQEQALRAELMEVATLVLAGVLAGAIIVLAGAGAFWIVCQDLRTWRTQPEVAKPLRQPAPARQVLLFPRAVRRREATFRPAPTTQRVARR